MAILCVLSIVWYSLLVVVFRSGAAHTLHCKVNNLDFANPTKIFVYNASSFHEVTYNTAMDNNILRKKRVFIAEAGSMFAFSTMSKVN
jgi:hypothetical protein